MDEGKNMKGEYELQVSGVGYPIEYILFNSPSGAAAFVCGSSANGNIEWKTADGITLKELDANTGK